jgi:ribosomal protein S18 acetylase RimI-like enzyme
MISAPTIGLATAADAETVAALSRNEIEQGLHWSWTPARVLRCIRDPHYNVIVAREGPRLLGFALASYATEHAHLSLFGVTPSHRRRGIATALWNWLEETMRTAGIGAVQVELRASNHAARAFYERVGFEQVNATRGYYQGLETALHMVKELTANSK